MFRTPRLQRKPTVRRGNVPPPPSRSDLWHVSPSIDSTVSVELLCSETERSWKDLIKSFRVGWVLAAHLIFTSRHCVSPTPFFSSLNFAFLSHWSAILPMAAPFENAPWNEHRRSLRATLLFPRSTLLFLTRMRVEVFPFFVSLLLQFAWLLFAQRRKAPLVIFSFDFYEEANRVTSVSLDFTLWCFKYFDAVGERSFTVWGVRGYFAIEKYYQHQDTRGT